MHEMMALAWCFAFPALSSYLLHTIRGQLSRPSEGLVSDYNLTIFLFAAELRPISHLIGMVRARTVGPISSIEGRKAYLRGQLMRDEATGEYLVQALGGAAGSSSHLLATLAEANCLVTVPPDTTEVDAGDEVEVVFLAQRG